jgi:AcrR family transcriptional regulator
VTDGTGKVMRRDAAQRREALIGAAAESFARAGYLVPLEEIAERAGVGRGTLYRNFPDRLALALAVFEREIDRLEEGLDPAMTLDRTIAELAVRGAKTAALFNRLAADMPLDAESMAQFKALGGRLERVIQPAVDRAHAAGTLRLDAGAKEVVLGLRMVSGLLKSHPNDPETETVVDEALAILMRGLGPR